MGIAAWGCDLGIDQFRPRSYIRRVLIGREAEMGELQPLVLRLCDGTGFGVVLHGSAGIGKSALLETLAEWARGRACVLRTSGVERETELVFAGLGELVAPLRHLIVALPDRHRSTLRSSLSLGEPTSHSQSEVFVAAASLLALAAERDCDLLVMGAYGHSRFRETLLGGVTRSMLDAMTLPLLMSH